MPAVKAKTNSTVDLQGFIEAVQAMGGKPDLSIAKRTAIEQFVRRTVYASTHEKYESEQLPAGSPVFVYCAHCGIMIERLPEDYLFPPYTECSQCVGLKKQGWLEEAKSKSKIALMGNK